MDNIKTEHESYGTIVFNRATANPPLTLVGSSIKHGTCVTLEISEASHRRGLNQDYFYAERSIVKLRLSPTQFAEAITAFGVGSGVPCTLEWVRGKGSPEEPPFEGKGTVFSREFADTCRDTAAGNTLYWKEAQEILESGKPIGKKDREKIQQAFTMVQQNIESNMPFVEQQFARQMDKTITEAKGAVEAFVEHKIRQTGIEAIRHEVGLLNEGTAPTGTEAQNG